MTYQQKLTPASAVAQQLANKGWAVLQRPDIVDRGADALLEFAKLFGEPVDRDGGCFVWPISSRNEHGTFSETKCAAPLHSDAQYHDRPDRLFMLACVKAASSGGETIILEFADALRAVQDSGLTERQRKLLAMPLWRWRVPTVFQTSSSAIISPPHPALTNRRIRWRRDNLVVEGSELLSLADHFDDILTTCPYRTTFPLEPGQILICDNFRVLHGRTAFTDETRMLFRVRLQ